MVKRKYVDTQPRDNKIALIPNSIHILEIERSSTTEIPMLKIQFWCMDFIKSLGAQERNLKLHLHT